MPSEPYRSGITGRPANSPVDGQERAGAVGVADEPERPPVGLCEPANGHPRGLNPYPAGSAASRSWYAGWWRPGDGPWRG